ncbi:MAG: HAD family hydrolase [Egibacteraceae bacterium]
MVIEAVGVDADPIAVAGRMQDLFCDPASYVAFPEVPDMLRRLAGGGHRVAILSNTDVDLWPILDRLSLGSFVEVAVAAFRHGVEKPSPQAFHLALDALGVEATSTWFVGDDLRDDCVASEALGMTAVLVDRSNHYGNNPDARRFLRLDNLAPLPELVRSLT